MLVRAYRLTDKFGIVILKSSAAFGHLTELGVTRITGVGQRSIGGVLAVVFGIILAILRGILGVFRAIFGLVFRILGGSARRVSQQAAGSVSTSTNNMMARRAARAEMTATVTEDPLR